MYAPRVTIAVLAAAVAALAPAAASARPADTIYQNKRLWATINICDTVGHPDSIGIRGSMPGSGDRAEHMFMRIQVQYYSASDAGWHNLEEDEAPGFVDVGSGRYRTRQSGRTITITPPPPGGDPHLLRGVVTFEWRKAGEVVRRARKRTTANHKGTNGSDPPGFTAATCTIS